jgi:hypothetical protein
MTTVIKLKRGTTTPTTSNIVSGEIAVDTSAQKLYINDASTIKTIGLGNPAVSDISDLTATPLNSITQMVLQVIFKLS